jgi:phosphotransacetylase/acyl dehydratase
MNLATDAGALIHNRTFEEIQIGDTATGSRTLSADDLSLFAIVSGNINPRNLDDDFEREGGVKGPVAPSLWGATVISAVLGNQLPGPGTAYRSQGLQFSLPVYVGDTLTATVTVREKRAADQTVVLECRGVNQHGKLVLSGTAEVQAPTRRITCPRTVLPEVHLQKHQKFRRLIARAEALPPQKTAVVHPCDESSLQAALDAARENLLTPILVGPLAKIQRVADKLGADLSAFELVDAPHSHAAAETAVALVRSGSARLLMKGSLHTDELMAAVVARDKGLRTERRISHCFMMDVPTLPQLLIVTDAAVNIAPSLAAKIDIAQNAIDLAHAIGIDEPRVAVLSAVETVNPDIASTMDAAALCKMTDRGQISGAIMDGPLALDNAVSLEAARVKQIASAVAGRANILLVPDLDAGNMLAKSLTFLANADAAGVVLGARVPIILTSRADELATKLASCAVAALVDAAHAAVPAGISL